MKNQYFGDKRDYIKWNLIFALAKTQRFNKSLTYLPMLTVDDSTREGLFIEYPIGKGDKRIHSYLRDCINDGYRDIKALREMFKKLGVEYKVFSDNEHFKDSNRDKYFSNVSFGSWKDDLVFIDPDVGIEPKTREAMISNGIDKYLLWDDIEGIHANLGSNTTLVIYQHLQFNANRVRGDLECKCDRLQQIWPDKYVDYLRDKDVAFLIVYNNRDVTEYLEVFAHINGLISKSNEASDVTPEVITIAVTLSEGSDIDVSNNIIRNAEKLSTQDVIGHRVLCPACKEKIFERWPLGWDAHAIRCKGVYGDNVEDKKKIFKAKFRHLFR